MHQKYLDSNSHEIGRCFRLFLPDTSVVLSTGSNRRNNLFCTNPYQLDFGGPFGLTNSHSCRKLFAPLIEPLSVRLQEGRLDESEEESDQETLSILANYSKIARLSTVMPWRESLFTKKQKLTILTKTSNFAGSDCVSDAKIARHSSTDGSSLGHPNTTCDNKSRNEEGLHKSPSIPTKPRTKLTWNNWETIPDTYHEKFNRTVERRSSKSLSDFKKTESEECFALNVR